MAISVTYPGVYIDEFEPSAPIQGVGTSTAAFLGLNSIGPPMTPTFLTSWDGYLQTFAPPAPTPPDDGDYLYYAVRGFFLNGGKTCYVTAVSNATADFLDLTDNATPAAKTITLTARKTGQSSPPITVTAVASNSVANVKLFAPEADVANATGDNFDVGDPAKAAQFLAGDAVTVGNTPATILRTAGSLVYLTAPLPAAVNAVKLRLAELTPFATTFRVVDNVSPNPKSAAGLVVGSVVTLTQGTGTGAPLLHSVVTAVRTERISPTLTTYRVTVRDGLNGFSLYPTPAVDILLKSEEFDLTVTQGAATFPYPGLSMTSGHPRYYATIINGDTTGPITAKPYDPPNTTALPDNRPLQTTAKPLTSGQNFDASVIRGRSVDYENALALLEGIRGINIVATPDRTDFAVQSAVLDHCTKLFDRVAIFDAVRVNPQQPKGTSLQNAIQQSIAFGDTKGFGALYFPWLLVTSLNTGQPLMVPPSGYVAGVYARTDATRGVFKAPAGVDCTVRGALGVDLGLSDNDQGVVNLKGVNVIRVFQSSGAPVVWGARTISQDTNWQYVNIRRLFLFLEQSIQIGIRNSVFEPNNPALWQSLKRTISAFLTQQWRDGALFGVKASDAFYIRIDDVLNPPSERALGRLMIEIGVQPAYPAEFIIVRIGIWQGGSDVTES